MPIQLHRRQREGEEAKMETPEERASREEYEKALKDAEEQKAQKQREKEAKKKAEEERKEEWYKDLPDRKPEIMQGLRQLRAQADNHFAAQNYDKVIARLDKKPGPFRGMLDLKGVPLGGGRIEERIQSCFRVAPAAAGTGTTAATSTVAAAFKKTPPEDLLRRCPLTSAEDWTHEGNGQWYNNDGNGNIYKEGKFYDDECGEWRGANAVRGAPWYYVVRTNPHHHQPPPPPSAESNDDAAAKERNNKDNNNVQQKEEVSNVKDNDDAKEDNTSCQSVSLAALLLVKKEENMTDKLSENDVKQE